MWLTGTLHPRELLARAMSWSREKLPSDAPQVGPPDDGKGRVELSEHPFRLGGMSVSDGPGYAALHHNTANPRQRARRRAEQGVQARPTTSCRRYLCELGNHL